MTDSSGKMVLYWGQSDISYDKAVQLAVAKAIADLGESILEWFEVVEFRGAVGAEGAVSFQVAIRIGAI